MSIIIGIDLGTTHSVVSHLGTDGPTIIPNALGEPLTPSVIGLDDDGRLLIGRAAKEYQVVRPERCATLFKRHMGSDWVIKIGDREFSPEELSSLVLRQLKEDAEAFLNESISRAVITVPAYFNDQQRHATINAGRIAGLKVERIINEPTAAALAYGFHEADEEKTLLVFDLGGGTFDVSIVEQFSGVLEVKSSAGETFLGGEDFTRSMASRILSERGKNFERTEMEAPLMVSRLIQQCELAKCRLTNSEKTAVRLPNAEGDLGEAPQEFEMTRAQFEKWTHHILGRVELPIRRVLGDGKLQRSEIDEIILVGGATRMPAVHDLVERLFEKKALSRINPDEAVAMGAAVQAGLIGQDQSVEDLVVTDVAPFTLGIETTKLFGQERRGGYFLPIIHRNTTIPVSRVETISTLFPNQTEVLIKIYQGENRRIDNNLYLGQFLVNGIPLGPAGQQVDVRFTYDLNGVLEVEATVTHTGKKFTHVVTQFARGMSEDQIERAVGQMRNLKTHPRDESENRVLLRKAERVFRELSHEMREELGILLDGFEAALAMRDPETIEQHREALEAFLDRYESGFDPPKPWNPYDDESEDE